jgi:hypothetical protein
MEYLLQKFMKFSTNVFNKKKYRAQWRKGRYAPSEHGYYLLFLHL